MNHVSNTTFCRSLHSGRACSEVKEVGEAIYSFRTNKKVDGGDSQKRQTLMELSGEEAKGHCSCGDLVLS